jgi:hypothetical protein
LIPKTIVSVIIIGLWAIYYNLGSKPYFDDFNKCTFQDLWMLLFLAVIYLQTSTYIAMFSNFK